MDGSRPDPDASELMRQIRSRHPGLREALVADMKVTMVHRGEFREFTSGLDALLAFIRLIWTTDGFLSQALYRLKAALQRRGVPLIPRLAHRLALISGQVSIGDPVIVHPGLCLLHGQIVVDGLVEIHPGVVVAPFVTLGLQPNNVVGPTIERGVRIGTGAKVLGPVHVVANAVIGANAVVLDDVPPGVTVVGAPARPVSEPV
jgi:serine O-acetyltransferase